MEEPECECLGPGFCERFQIAQNEYTYGLCSGKGGPGDRPCSSEKSEMMRRSWRLKLAAKSAGGPGLVQKARNATEAFIRSASRGFRAAPPEVAEERARICQSNECGFYNQDKGSCQHPKCGCPITVNRLVLGVLNRPGKVEVATERCPVGLWGRVPPETITSSTPSGDKP